MRLCNHAMMASAVAGAMMSAAYRGESDTAASQAAGGNDGTPASKQTFNLKLNHGLAEDHTVHIRMAAWAEVVKEKLDGAINIQTFPNGQLGSEADNVSSIQAGTLDMAEVSASALGNFNRVWNALSVPYAFNDKDHYYKAMDGEIAGELYDIAKDDSLIGLTWLDSGSRFLYTASTPIQVPAGLKGLKTRTMDSQIVIDIINVLDGSTTVMSYSEIYTGLQQRVIDGAENNITAFRDHSDVIRYYCYDKYAHIPNVIVISTKVWNQMSDSQKNTMREIAATATNEYKTRWAGFESEVKTMAEGDGIALVKDVDTAAFQGTYQSIYDGLKTSNTEVYAITKKIQAAGG